MKSDALSRVAVFVAILFVSLIVWTVIKDSPFVVKYLKTMDSVYDAVDNSVVSATDGLLESAEKLNLLR